MENATKIVFLSIISLPLASLIPLGSLGKTDNIIYLGTAGRKSFYSVPMPKRTWTEARDFCNNTHMELATITTPEESNLLRNVANNETFEGERYWSAGRDAHSHNQFVWDADRETVNSIGVPIFYVHPSWNFQSCLLYKMVLDRDPIYDEFQPRLCTLAVGTLCMVRH